MAETTTIEAPMPGVFYRRPDPDDPVFVEEGDDVEAGEKVALIGVMKNFHDITTETDGVLAEFLVENETEVEAGDALAVVETS
jgi:acetyl-CoA carboxylase biotin carboxyl carrier protein